jgi:hypothetical protein
MAANIKYLYGLFNDFSKLEIVMKNGAFGLSSNFFWG